MRQGPVTAGSGQSIPAIALGRDEIGPAQFLEHQFGLSPRHMLAGYAAHHRERCLIGTDAVRIPLEQEDDHSPLQGCWTEVVRHNQCQLSLTLRSEEHTSELQSPCNLVCRLLLEKKQQ